MHCATNKQFLLMMTVVAVMTMMPIVIVTCLDRLPRNFNFRSIWTFSECELVNLHFSGIGLPHRS